MIGNFTLIFVEVEPGSSLVVLESLADLVEFIKAIEFGDDLSKDRLTVGYQQVQDLLLVLDVIVGLPAEDLFLIRW